MKTKQEILCTPHPMRLVSVAGTLHSIQEEEEEEKEELTRCTVTLVSAEKWSVPLYSCHGCRGHADRANARRAALIP